MDRMSVDPAFYNAEMCIRDRVGSAADVGDLFVTAFDNVVEDQLVCIYGVVSYICLLYTSRCV